MSTSRHFSSRLLLGAALCAFVASIGAQPASEKAIEFHSAAGETVAAFRGSLLVPENRSNPDSRLITLAYVRFPSTSPEPGAPIVYLAGGPGGSGIGTAAGSRFPLFVALREVADVIAFDQRGTGQSTA